MTDVWPDGAEAAYDRLAGSVGNARRWLSDVLEEAAQMNSRQARKSLNTVKLLTVVVEDALEDFASHCDDY